MKQDTASLERERERMEKQEQEQNRPEVEEQWTEGKNPGSFAGVDIFKHHNDKLSREDILNNKLPSIPVYQKFKTFKAPRVYNPYFVRNKRKVIQSDLLHMLHPQGIKSKNNGYAYILVVQDIFSRKIWTAPLKDKRAESLIPELKTIFNNMKPFKKGAYLVIDRGTEYLNKLVKDLLAKYNLKIVHPSDGHASFVERSILSLQRLLYRQMSQNGQTKRWLEFLPIAENLMNNRYHRIIRMTPNNAEKEKKKSKVNEAMSIYRQKAFNKERKRKKLQPKFNVGDHVRIHKWKNKFGRGYTQSFSTEVFKIIEIQDHLPITMYTISDLSNEKIIGNFYAEEMSKAQGEIFIVEEILEEKIKNKQKWVLVKWEGYPDSENSWIKHDDLISK